MGKNLIYRRYFYMKKRIIAAVLLALLALGLCSCTAKEAKNEGYDLYRSSPVGVEIEYPDFWEVVDDKEEKSVAFATPLEGYADTYRDNVTVISYKLTEKSELAFDNYVSDYIASLPSDIAGYSLVSEGEYKVDGYKAYRVVYEGETNEGTLRISHTFIKNGKRVYIYTFIAEPKSYDYFNKNSEVMLSTFKALLDK